MGTARYVRLDGAFRMGGWVMPTQWTQTSQRAMALVDQLSEQIDQDLDLERGGTSWLHGQIDWKRNCVSTDYALSSAHGVSDALESTRHEVERFRTSAYARDFATRTAIADARGAGRPATEAIFSADDRSRKRNLEVRLASEHAFMHMAQTLDRMAALTIFVTGLHRSMLTASWTAIEGLINNPGRLQSGGRIGRQTDRGLDRQREMFERWRALLAGQEADWLPWLCQTRNLTVHRSEMAAWNMQIKAPGKTERLIAPYVLQPDWATLEVMVGENVSLGDFYLLEEPEDVLEGLADRTAALVEQMLLDLLQLWSDRRDDPTLIIQPGAQWPKLRDGRLLKFVGFGSPVHTTANEVRLGPRMARRLMAAKVMEGPRGAWDR